MGTVRHSVGTRGTPPGMDTVVSTVVSTVVVNSGVYSGGQQWWSTVVVNGRSRVTAVVNGRSRVTVAATVATVVATVVVAGSGLVTQRWLEVRVSDTAVLSGLRFRRSEESLSLRLWLRS